VSNIDDSCGSGSIGEVREGVVMDDCLFMMDDGRLVDVFAELGGLILSLRLGSAISKL
jgi:hypothetical protein